LSLILTAGAGTVASPVAAAAIRVAVEQGAGSNGSAAELAAQLNDDTFFDFTATVVTAADIDTVAELQDYDVVIFGDSGNANNDWTLAMATALRDWAQNNGGGVVSVGWADYAITGSDVARDTVLDEVMPIDSYPNGNNEFCFPPGLAIDILTTAHPVTAGLSDFALPTSGDVEISPFAPDATNGQVLGTASGGGCTNATTNTIVVGELGSGRLVYLGPVYLGSVNYNNGDLRSGSPDRLLEQAVAWAADAIEPPDDDGDGVPNSEDLCPGTAQGAEVDENGCPPVEEDEDEDVRRRRIQRPRGNVSAAVVAILGNRNPTPAAGAVGTGGTGAPASTALGAPRTGDGGLLTED
jgi:uncharacterized membrane protein